LGLALTTVENEWYIPVGHEPFMGNQPNNIVLPTDLLKNFDGVIAAHNMKFDFHVVTGAGLIVPTDNLWCTMLQSVYMDENRHPGHDLDTVLDRYVGEHKKKIEKAALEKFGWTKAPIDYMAIYATQDSRHLPQLHLTLLNQMDERHIQLWENVDRKFMLLLVEMERQGILIDRDLCEQLGQKCHIRLLEIQQELGFDPAKTSQLHPKLFADPPFGLGLKPASYTAGGKVPNKKTGKTRPPQPQVSLEWLASVGHPITALVYEYRKTQKQLSSYFAAYLRVTTRDYPRLHPDFNMGTVPNDKGGEGGTVTGRLSCRNPNLQQIPREEYKDAYVKKLFLPETGRQLWEIDYRTIEYRLQAVYAQSAELIALFEAEGDFHQLVADDVSAKLGFNITRQDAKTVNYLMSYGGGVPVLASKLKISPSKARDIHSAYKEAYPEIFEKADEAQWQAECDMQIDMWSGRTRHFQWKSECHSAFNAVIQGGCGEIVKRSMLRLQEAGFNIANQVHDSVWLNVDSEKDVIEAQKIMEKWTKPLFGLTFRTDRKRLN
jgi:DNA polymerase-1